MDGFFGAGLLGGRQSLANLGNFLFTADKTGQLHRQIMGRAFDKRRGRPRWRWRPFTNAQPFVEQTRLGGRFDA